MRRFIIVTTATIVALAAAAITVPAVAADELESVSGKVVDSATGQGVAGVGIVLWPDPTKASNAGAYSAITAADGTFTLEDPSGYFSIVNNGGTFETEGTAEVQPSKEYISDLSQDVTLTADPGGVIRGDITGSGPASSSSASSDSEGVTIAVVQAPSLEVQDVVTVENDGTYEAWVPFGNYHLEINRQENSHGFRAQFQGGAPESTDINSLTPVNVSAQAPEAVVDAVLSPGATLFGALQGPANEDLSACTVTVQHADESFVPKSVQSDSDGSFTISGLEAGTSTLRVSPEAPECPLHSAVALSGSNELSAAAPVAFNVGSGTTNLGTLTLTGTTPFTDVGILHPYLVDLIWADDEGLVESRIVV